MEITKEETPSESICTSAVCSHCGGTMFTEEIFAEEEQSIPHRKVTGCYVQFLDEEGVSTGPFWPVCETCETNPLESIQVKAKYSKLINSKEF
jgi:hypothetical protein